VVAQERGSVRADSASRVERGGPATASILDAAPNRGQDSPRSMRAMFISPPFDQPATADCTYFPGQKRPRMACRVPHPDGLNGRRLAAMGSCPGEARAPIAVATDAAPPTIGGVGGRAPDAVWGFPDLWLQAGGITDRYGVGAHCARVRLGGSARTATRSSERTPARAGLSPPAPGGRGPRPVARGGRRTWLGGTVVAEVVLGAAGT